MRRRASPVYIRDVWVVFEQRGGLDGRLGVRLGVRPAPRLLTDIKYYVTGRM